MMRLDRDRGCLRIDGATLQGLLARILHFPAPTAPQPDESGLFDAEEAERAGILDHGRPAEGITPLFETIAVPWAAIRLTVLGLGEDRSHRLWLGPRTAVLVVHLGGGEYDLGGVPLTGVPATLARLARLGPREGHALERSLEAPTEALAGILRSGDPHAVDSLLPLLPASAFLDALRAGRWRTLAVEAEWAPGLFPSGSDLVAERLILSDTAAGVVEIEIGPETSRLRPVTPTEVWPRLIRLAQPPPGVDADGDYARSSAEPIPFEFG
jgi:hypothetical protein